MHEAVDRQTYPRDVQWSRGAADPAAASVTERVPIGVFRTVFPAPYETFIQEQVAALRRFEPHMVVREHLAPGGGRVHAPSAAWKRRLWTLTRWPGAFPLRELRGLRLLHAHFGLDAVMALPLSRRLGIPLVTTFHGSDVTTDRTRFARSRKPTQRWFAARESELIREGAAFVAVSRFVEQKLLACGYPPDKVRQIYIGIDLERFVPAPRRDGPRYVLCVARHTFKKGLDTLIRAWARIAARHPDVELWQVGEGGLTPLYVRLAQELGVGERMRFLGVRSHDEVLGLMQQAEVFVLPSQTAEDGDSEALGIVFNEASACCVPVVSTWHGGIPEAVLHGETGLLCQERDDTALAEHIDLLLRDRALALRLGRRGREYVCEMFDIRKQTPKLEALYDEVMTRGAPAARTAGREHESLAATGSSRPASAASPAGDRSSESL